MIRRGERIGQAMILRVSKEQSALLYQLLEGYDGITNYSTLDAEDGQGYRDIQLYFPPEMRNELLVVLKNISEAVDFVEIKKDTQAE
jgi:hypothetical protein